MKILIGTPAYDGQVCMEYYVAVLQLIAHMARTRPTVSLSPRPFEATLISVARNVLATKALTAGFDYLLFIDADMGFQPSLIDKMLDANQPIVRHHLPKAGHELRTPAPHRGQPLRRQDMATCRSAIRRG